MLFTAFNEDWGIVPIEAMAFGKPVICVNRGGPLESVQNGVQGFLEEPEPERFAGCMARLAENPDLAKRMGAAGPARARLFSWDAFVNKIDLALDEIAGQTATPEALVGAAADEPEILVSGREGK
jgi:glycosyltransferase involved in cell wall biosynthesis